MPDLFSVGEATRYVLLLLIASLLFAQWYFASRLRTGARILVQIQAIFWFIAYFLRPLYLVLIVPDRVDPLYDRRLAWSNYSGAMEKVFLVVSVGLTASTLITFCLSRTTSFSVQFNQVRPEQGPEIDSEDYDLRVLAVLFTLGWIGRGGLLVGVDAAGPTLGTFATVATCLGVYRLKTATRAGHLAMYVAVGSEVAWTLLFESKTPLLALLTAFVLRWARDLSRQQMRRRIPVVAVVVMLVFLVVQPLKGIETANEAQRYSDADNLAGVGLTISFLERFDLFSAVTDAYFYSRRPWLPPDEFVTTLALGAVPKGPFVEFENSGLRWTREVRSDSIPDQFQDVYLATGAVAEGYVQAGTWGVFLESGFVTLLAALIGRLVSARSLVTAVAAAVFAFDPVLYERGLLGQSAIVTKALQALVVSYILVFVFNKIDEHRSADSQLVGGRD